MPVTISSLGIESVELPHITFSVECSKGTYVRSLIDDVGQKLGCGACMSALTRTRSGRFSLEDAHTLAELETLKEAGRIEEALIPLSDALDAYPKMIVKEAAEKKARNGGRLAFSEFTEEKDGSIPEDGGVMRLFLPDGTFVGLYYKEGGLIRPKKVFL